MSKITREHILKLAQLSRLRLTEDEITCYQAELSAILEYVERLDGVDTAGFEPTYQVSGLENQFRADTLEGVKLGYAPEDLMKLAPRAKDGYIQVGRMI